MHELSLAARFCSRLLLLGQGGLLAEGSPEKVLTAELLSQAYGVAMEAVSNPLTGHIDIFTSQPERDAQHRRWLQTLLTDGVEGGGER